MSNRWTLFLEDRDEPSVMHMELTSDLGAEMHVARSIEAAKDLVLRLGFPCHIFMHHAPCGEDVVLSFLAWLRPSAVVVSEPPTYSVLSSNERANARIHDFMARWDETQVSSWE